MKLVDFKLDEQLNGLRRTMGADQFGNFELFDPERHLSWQDRQTLAKEWMNINTMGLHAGHEQALYFKNSPVVAQVEDTFHFALCDDLKKRLGSGQLQQVAVTTNVAAMIGAGSCPYCLHAIAYEGFDVYRHRHQEYNDKILKSFNLKHYLEKRSF